MGEILKAVVIAVHANQYIGSKRLRLKHSPPEMFSARFFDIKFDIISI